MENVIFMDNNDKTRKFVDGLGRFRLLMFPVTDSRGHYHFLVFDFLAVTVQNY